METELPIQKIQPAAGYRTSDSDNESDPPTPRGPPAKKRLFDLSYEEETICTPRKELKLYPCFKSGYGMDYLTAAKDNFWNPKEDSSFFSPSKLVHEFGLLSTCYVRLGFCSFNKGFKLYLRKDNPGASPSVVGILYADAQEVILHLRNTLKSLDDSVEAGKPLLKPAKLKDFRIGKSDQHDFWDDAFYTATGTFRVKHSWNFGNKYLFFLNGVSAGDFIGPKIRLLMTEVKDLVNIMHEIVEKCPPRGTVIREAL